jgi:hypothetical protein
MMKHDAILGRTAMTREDPMPTDQEPNATPPRDWKYRLGMGLFIYSFIPICTIELVALLPLTATEAVTLGAVYIASGEIALLAAVALLGKPFIQSMKEKIKGFFRRKAPSTPRMISKTRHYIGVTLLVASLFPYYATLGALLFAPLQKSDIRTLLYLLLSGEALFLVSLFVLGDEFWARLKRLFEWPGKEQTATA